MSGTDQGGTLVQSKATRGETVSQTSHVYIPRKTPNSSHLTVVFQSMEPWNPKEL